MTAFKNILLDLDGTLSDPAEGFVKAITYALEKLDIAVPDRATIESYIGPPLHESGKELLGTDDPKVIDQYIDYYREIYNVTGKYENKIYEGIPELLTGLVDAGYRLFLATSKPWPTAQSVVKHFKLDHHFTTMHGSELDGTRKAKPELLAYILEQENLDPAETIMIGDRKYDLIGATANNIKAIGVSYGYGSVAELEEHGAHHICHTPADIAKFFNIQP